jgi:hypothetical protein
MAGAGLAMFQLPGCGGQQSVRHARNHLIRANLHAPATPAGVALAVGRDPAGQREWSPVRATGHWDVGHQLLVRLRPFQGEVGFFVVTPLITDTGPAVLVNRWREMLDSNAAIAVLVDGCAPWLLDPPVNVLLPGRLGGPPGDGGGGYPCQSAASSPNRMSSVHSPLAQVQAGR